MGEEAASQALGKAVGRSGGDVKAAVREAGDALGRKNRAATEKLMATAEEGAKDFAKTTDGIADINRQALDRRQAEQLIDRLKRAEPGTPGFEDALRQLQSNKTAQSLINGKDIPDELRQRAKAGVTAWYDAADAGTRYDIKGLLAGNADVAKEARRMGLDTAEVDKLRRKVRAQADARGVPVEDFKVEVKTITNKRPLKPGEVETTSFGRDRDVTFEIVAPDGTRFDVDHRLSTNVYEQNFWVSSLQKDLPMKSGAPDMDKIGKYSHETMDQTVTSKWHNEAYNPGEVKLDDFLDKGVQPTITRIEDVRDTVVEKSQEWFNRASAAADPVEQSRNIAEGMRQASKQYDDLIMSRVEQYGRDFGMSRDVVPPQLQASMSIFKQVKDGTITPKQAEYMLAKIGTSPEKAVRDMGSMFETVEKVAGDKFRKDQLQSITSNIKSITASGGAGWQDRALLEINNGLRTGSLSGQDFMKLRGEVLRKASVNKSPTEFLDWANQARSDGLISSAELDQLRAQYELSTKPK